MEKIGNTILKKSNKIKKCTKCNNTNLKHVEFDVDNIDTSWEEETIQFIDGYMCEHCNYIISGDDDHFHTTIETSDIIDNDIRRG